MTLYDEVCKVEKLINARRNAIFLYSLSDSIISLFSSGWI